MSGIALYATLVVFGVFTGVAAGLLGVGGGIMMVPFLTLVAGVSQHAAQATSLLVVLPTRRSRRTGTCSWKLRHCRGFYGTRRAC